MAWKLVMPTGGLLYTVCWEFGSHIEHEHFAEGIALKTMFLDKCVQAMQQTYTGGTTPSVVTPEA